MRVLFVSHYASLYGANLSMLNLITYLRENYAIDFHVLLPCKGKIENELTKLNIQYSISRYPYWMHESDKPLFKWFKRSIRGIFENKKVLKCFRNTQFDIVHTNSSVINIGALLSSKLHCPHIWHIREFGKEDYNLLYNRGNYFATRYMCKHSDKIIAISKSIYNKYSKYIDPQKLELVYNGVPSQDDIFQIHLEEKTQSNIINLAIVGRISEEKNQLEAIKAIFHLSKMDNCKDIRLYIIGDGDKQYIEDIMQYSAEHKLDNIVSFTGFQPNVSEILKEMDIGLVCSKKEAFGRVTVEYMLSGMPVIGSNTGGTAEVIHHGTTGYLYELGNIEQLANYINELSSDSKLLKKMASNAREIALKEFSIDQSANKIYEIYKLSTWRQYESK